MSCLALNSPNFFQFRRGAVRPNSGSRAVHGEGCLTAHLHAGHGARPVPREGDLAQVCTVQLWCRVMRWIGCCVLTVFLAGGGSEKVLALDCVSFSCASHLRVGMYRMQPASGCIANPPLLLLFSGFPRFQCLTVPTCIAASTQGRQA